MNGPASFGDERGVRLDLIAAQEARFPTALREDSWDERNDGISGLAESPDAEQQRAAFVERPLQQ